MRARSILVALRTRGHAQLFSLPHINAQIDNITRAGAWQTGGDEDEFLQLVRTASKEDLKGLVDVLAPMLP